MADRVRLVFDRLLGDVQSLWPDLTVRLKVGRSREFPGDRDFAYTDGRTITVAPDLSAQTLARIEGVLRHEFGHVVEERGRLGDLAGYKSVFTERRADQIARAIWESPIRYDRDDVQNTEEGVHPRPLRLPQ